MKLVPQGLLALLLVAGIATAQNSAPSSHMVFDDNFDGDIIINQVRVPKDGAQMYTYYEALGWRGRAAGYAGIQVHPRARNFIYSIWDHKDHSAPIKAVHQGPGTDVQGFGGEGTGLKSWNFKLGWKTDVWYTLLSRNWAVGDHTYFGFWARAGDTRQWTHLVTMDVAVPMARFRGRTDAFIEDWLSTGAKPRTTNLRGGWKRKPDGSWHAFGSGRYSVNSWDLVKGKRSFNFRMNWDGGVRKDKEGAYYFMVAGGKKTTPAAKNPSRHTIARRDTRPDFPSVRIKNVSASRQKNSIRVAWTTDNTSTPQFAYRIRIFDNAKGTGQPVVDKQDRIPHVRSVNIEGKQLTGDGKWFVHLQCTDVLDRTTTKIVPLK